MKRHFLTAAAMLLVIAGVSEAQSQPKPTPGSDAQPVAVMLEQAIYQEETAGNLDAAAKAYNQIVEQAAVSRALVAQALSRLAALEVKQKQLAEARQTIDRLKKEYPEQQDLIAKAEALLPDTSSSTAATTDTRPPTPEEKQQAAELAKQGWQSYRDGKFKPAADLFERATKLDPKSVDAWNGLGWSMMNLNSITGQNQFYQALQRDPKNAMALNGLGWVTWHTNPERKEDAVKYWQRAVEADPTATSAMSGLAQNAIENCEFDEAIKWYEKWLAQDPKNADATAGLDRAKQGQTVVKEASALATEFFKKLDDGKFAETGSLTTPRTAGSFQSAEMQAQTNSIGRAGQTQFGDFELDRTAKILSKAGDRIELTPKEFAVLDLFTRRAGRALTRDEILRRVWGAYAFVSGRSVDRCINTLRGKIEDDLSGPRWIQTVRETGYRFDTHDCGAGAKD